MLTEVKPTYSVKEFKERYPAELIAGCTWYIYHDGQTFFLYDNSTGESVNLGPLKYAYPYLEWFEVCKGTPR